MAIRIVNCTPAMADVVSGCSHPSEWEPGRDYFTWLMEAPCWPAVETVLADRQFSIPAIREPHEERMLLHSQDPVIPEIQALMRQAMGNGGAELLFVLLSDDRCRRIGILVMGVNADGTRIAYEEIEREV